MLSTCFALISNRPMHAASLEISNKTLQTRSGDQNRQQCRILQRVLLYCRRSIQNAVLRRTHHDRSRQSSQAVQRTSLYRVSRCFVSLREQHGGESRRQQVWGAGLPLYQECIVLG